MAAASPNSGILHHLHVTYNYNPQSMLSMRDRVFHALFVKGSLLYDCVLPKRARNILEFGLLLSALLSFATLVFVHVIFIRSPIRCLEGLGGAWPHDGVLRVELLRHPLDLRDAPYSIEKSYAKELALQPQMQSAAITTPARFADWAEPHEDDTSQFGTNPFGSSLLRSMHLPRTGNASSAESATSLPTPSRSPSTFERLAAMETAEQVRELRRRLKREVWPSEEYIVEYSLDYGLLRLSPATRQKLNISVKLVTVDAKHDKCLGDGVSRFLMDYFLGYNDVLMGSLKSLAEKEDNKGYVRNVVTGEHFRFVSMWTTRSSYLTALLIMVVFTLSISMLMRYTHHQIFVLIVELLHLLEFNSPRTFRTAPIFTVILALVGMEAIMSEFFNDSTTAFGVIFVVWIADHFDAVCSHTQTTKRHWLKFFFLYHFAFYAYDYRFNGQYSGLALFTSFLFILHSMVFFYHRFELPDVLRQTNGPLHGSHGSTSSAGQTQNSASRQDSSNPMTEPTVTRDGNTLTITASGNRTDNSTSSTITVVARVSIVQRNAPPPDLANPPQAMTTPPTSRDVIRPSANDVRERERKMSTSTDEGNGSCCASDAEEVTSSQVTLDPEVTLPEVPSSRSPTPSL